MTMPANVPRMPVEVSKFGVLNGYADFAKTPSIPGILPKIRFLNLFIERRPLCAGGS